MKIDAGSTSTSIENLEWDPITVLSVPRQLYYGLYAFDDLPLDYSSERYSWVQMNCCCT